MLRTASYALLAATLAAAPLPEAAARSCNPNIPATAPDSRYEDNGDGTVTDRVSGLTWKQCTEGLTSGRALCDSGAALPLTWQQALQQAEQVNANGGFAGHTDWRLPNRSELASLIEYRCETPALNAAFFPASAWDYWSASPDASSASRSWYVYFRYGNVDVDGRDASHFVRLVRGGQ